MTDRPPDGHTRTHHAEADATAFQQHAAEPAGDAAPLPERIGRYRILGKPAEGLPFLEESLAIYQRDHSDEVERIADTRSMYGGVLVQLERFDQAEPILLEAYRTLKDAGSVKRTGQALERVLKLYDAWGKPTESARWRKLQQTSS